LSQSPSPVGKEAQQIRIVIAERDCMSAQSLAESLERDSRFRVIAASSADELVSIATHGSADVAVISSDSVSGAKKGLQVARILSVRLPGVRLVLLLDSLTRDAVLSAFRSGVRGVFCRTEPISEFRDCIEQVSRGEIWTQGIAGEYLVEAVKSNPSCAAIEGHLGMLSKREIEVAQHAVQGLTNKQIASQLQLSEHTVKNYLFRIFEKLGVSNRMELLFLLSARDKDALLGAAQSAEGAAKSLRGHLRAAHDGWVSEQFLVGLAYFEGRGTEKNDRSAYYWLRMAEENSLELRQHIRMLIEEVKAKMTSQLIEELEKSLMADKKKTLLGRRLELTSEATTGPPTGVALVRSA
jgi:two-component system, NarL family, nitrate/nitrite response regulator NarL